MAGLCKAILIGNLGRDPEVRYTPDGLAVANFSLAASERVKGEDRTQWFRVTAFGRLGEICGEYLQKGKQVYIEGRLQSSEWEDRDGNKRFTLEVIASQMLMLGGRDSTGAPRQSFETPEPDAPDEMAGPPFPDDKGDDIPF
jgi:single-strand DNA-binding protein